jgi:hypothetical protein
MRDLNPATNTDPFPDWPFGVGSSDARGVICRDESIRVPLDVAECPNCHFMLEAKPGMITTDASGTRWITTIRLRCRSGDGGGPCSEHCDWPGVKATIRDWMRKTYQVPPRDHTVGAVEAALFDADE